MSQQQAQSLPPPASSLLPVDNNILYGHPYHDTILQVHPAIRGHLSDRKQNYVRPSSPSDAARDAQTESGFPVDEKVILSGGISINGWKKQGKVWVADVPVFNGLPLDFRQLWVNGKKAVRARDVEDSLVPLSSGRIKTGSWKAYVPPSI